MLPVTVPRAGPKLRSRHGRRLAEREQLHPHGIASEEELQ